ncbi:MAG TPA: hypothetical protein VM051_02025 [Usitatibacter sp.]|nr:hypothetical protein [Usitatibacter sp.]
MPPAANPVFANVAVLRIPGFGARSVSEQAAAKEKVERATREAIEGIAASERVVLDTDDGLAVIVFGDPARALRLAQDVSSANGGDALQGGVNHGPLALTSRGADGRIFGDGLAAAFAAARFAAPGKVLVTREFAQMLGRRNPARAAELTSAGDFTDTRVRQHTFYTPDPRRGAMHRRRMVAYGIGGVVAILLLGFGGREAKIRLTPAPPAVLSFQVKPRGEVIVDGMVRGRVPGLTELEVPHGKHVLRIQNAPAPAFEVMLDLKPGERRTITHTFVMPRPKPPPEPPKPDFWRDLKKKFS